MRAPLADWPRGLKGSDPLMDQLQIMQRIDLPLILPEDAGVVGHLLLIRVHAHPVAADVHP